MAQLLAQFRRPPKSQMEPQEEASPPKLTSLTHSQVELLSVFMKERFDGFVSGRLYTFERIVPPDRGRFLWFETSLLLCLLTTDLESASEAEAHWKRIVPPLLTVFSPDITDARINEILTAARGYRDTWMMHEYDGPLGKVLDTPILAAFDCNYDDERWPEVLKLSATKILEDNAEFLNKYRSIVHHS